MLLEKDLNKFKFPLPNAFKKAEDSGSVDLPEDEQRKIHRLLDLVASNRGLMHETAERQIKKILMSLYIVLHSQAREIDYSHETPAQKKQRQRLRRAARRMLSVAQYSITNFIHAERKRLSMPIASLRRVRADGLVPILVSGLKNISASAIQLSKKAMAQANKLH